MYYPDFDAWRRRLEADSALPEGFRIATASLEFTPAEKPDAGFQPMNLAVIRLDEPSSSFAGVFTKNAFPGWPVVIGRELLNEPEIRGVVVNNRVANVGTACGLDVSRRVAAAAAEAFGDGEPYLPSSTGVIGWSLPFDAMAGAIHKLSDNGGQVSLLPFAEAIMTTDAWPKVRSAVCGEGLVTGTAKGAGMVEPNMATMLSFILTDVDVPRDEVRRILAETVEASFNRISVDGETSTSDTVLLISSGKRPCPGEAAFSSALMDVADGLSEDVVRNGEGTSHVFRMTVLGAPDERTAVLLARAVVNAPLTKTAVRGNDPNVGRILQAVGAASGRLGLELDSERLELIIGGRRVFGGGMFRMDAAVEEALAQYFRDAELPVPHPGWPVHEKRVEIELSLGLGDGDAAVTGSDLSEEYVAINADYRT